MEYFRNAKEENDKAKWMVKLCLLLVFIIGSSYIGLEYYRPFHIVVEVFCSFIALGVFIIAVNSYEISQSIPFFFLGVAYGIAGGFNIIHIIASNGMGFFQGDTTNLSMIFSIIPRFITAVSILISCRLFYKPYKIVKPFVIVFGFSVLSAAICMSVFFYDKFPACYVQGHGLTTFKIITEYVISGIALISLVILYKVKKYIEANVFLLLQFYMFFTIISSILLNFYTVQQEITNVLAHVLRLISYYFIYRVIVKVGIKTPYKLLFNELNCKNNSLKLKDVELNQTVNQLERENKLRKDLEELFLKNEACYKLLIGNSQDTIIIYNYEEIIFANESAAGLIEIDQSEELIGKAVTKFFPLYSEQTALEMIKEKRNEKDINLTYETQIVSINGRITYVAVTSAYVIYQNGTAILSIIKDISQHMQIERMKKDIEKDRKLLNDTLEFNSLIKEFFSNISHELRTPLNVILSALQVLNLEERKDKYEEISEKRSRYFKVMRQNCYRLLRLINNLIDISTIDSGYLKPNLKNYNIVSIVEDITLSVAEYIENKDVEIIFDTNVEEKIIACDPDNIERIMMNLLSNAVKFTNAGDKITVEIIVKDEYIEISVKDTGIGIPKDKLQVIFERFRQVDNSLSRSHEGSGIGLSLVKALVDMHGGSILVNSNLGEGTEFIIKLPASKIDNSNDVERNFIYQDNIEKIGVEFSDIYI
jgi:PAS domain S-box-containing protein